MKMWMTSYLCHKMYVEIPSTGTGYKLMYIDTMEFRFCCSLILENKISIVYYIVRNAQILYTLFQQNIYHHTWVLILAQ